MSSDKFEKGWLSEPKFEPNQYGSTEYVVYSKNGFRRPFKIIWCDYLNDDPRSDSDPNKYILPTLTTKQDRWPNSGIICTGNNCIHKKEK